MTPELDAEIRSAACNRVAEGFDDATDIVEGLCDQFSDEAADEEVRPIAEHATDEALREHLVAQEHWSIPTDCDRIDRAFAALERAGIVARQNFTCCQTCGHVEIGDELDDRSVGYTFFHQQDTESAVEGYGICLAYGAVAESDEAAVAVARSVTEALEREGLTVTWNGTSQQRIQVALDWKRRRPR